MKIKLLSSLKRKRHCRKQMISTYRYESHQDSDNHKLLICAPENVLVFTNFAKYPMLQVKALKRSEAMSSISSCLCCCYRASINVVQRYTYLGLNK